jgi:hypothetical protein
LGGMGAFDEESRLTNTNMKTLIFILSAIVVLGIVAVPARAETTNDTEFVRKIVEVFRDCQKIKPGMTRAELIKLQMFDQDWEPLHLADDKAFKQHTTFQYRSCALIKVDVDFGATGSKEVQPTDVITKVSMPYIDARPRR